MTENVKILINNIYKNKNININKKYNYRYDIKYNSINLLNYIILKVDKMYFYTIFNISLKSEIDMFN